MRAIVLATANATRIRAESSKAGDPAKPAAVSMMQVTATPAAVPVPTMSGDGVGMFEVGVSAGWRIWSEALV